MGGRDTAGQSHEESDERPERWQVDARSGQGQQVGEGNVQHNWFGPPGPPALDRALEQLGSDKAPERLGGIHALEQIAKDSIDDRANIAEILTAYIRERAPWPPASPLWRWPRLRDTSIQTEKLMPLETRARDVQAALTLLGKPQLWTGAEPFVLSSVDLRKANLRKANLQGADLRKANLQRADLTGANLSGARLDGANLSSASLAWANLCRAWFLGANLSHAALTEANLSHAGLEDANLSRAWFEKADLSDALLGGANLAHAHLDGARLHGARLVDNLLVATGRARVGIKVKGLKQAQLDAAHGDAMTTLPDGLWRPTSWTAGADPTAADS